eukprot:6208057-Pleurochrysis_carterae.AAC.4
MQSKPVKDSTRQVVDHPPTHSPTSPPTHPPFHPPTYQVAYLPVHLTYQSIHHNTVPNLSQPPPRRRSFARHSSAPLCSNDNSTSSSRASTISAPSSTLELRHSRNWRRGLSLARRQARKVTNPRARCAPKSPPLRWNLERDLLRLRRPIKPVPRSASNYGKREPRLRARFPRIRSHQCNQGKPSILRFVLTGPLRPRKSAHFSTNTVIVSSRFPMNY